MLITVGCSKDTETLLMKFQNRDVSEVVMSAVSCMVCLLRLLGWNRESSCCCCPSASGQVELMHYLKSPPLALCASLSLYPPIHSKSQTAKGRRHNGDKEVIHPPAPTNNPSKTHTQANKHTQPPLTYHRCPRTSHTREAASTQMRTPSCSVLSLLWIPSHVSCSLPVTPPPSAISLSLPDLIMAPPG